MKNLFAILVFTFSFLATTKAQYIEMPDGNRLDTTVVYHEPHRGVGDSLHVVAYNNFMRVEIDLVFIEYSGMTNFIARDKSDYLWLVRRSKNANTGWYYWELIDLENISYIIKYYDRQRL